MRKCLEKGEKNKVFTFKVICLEASEIVGKIANRESCGVNFILEMKMAYCQGDNIIPPNLETISSSTIFWFL